MKMKTKMNKQMFLGFAIIAVAAIMLTSQIAETYAAPPIKPPGNKPVPDQECINETLTGEIFANIVVSTQASFNTCIIDDAIIRGNVFVQPNAAVFIYDGTFIHGNVDLKGAFSAVNFEGTRINTVDGNILGEENTYVYLDSVTILKSVITSGEVYASGSPVSGNQGLFDRNSGPVTINGNIDISLTNDTNEFELISATVLGSVLVDDQVAVQIFDSNIGGSLVIKDGANISGNNPFIKIEFTDIGGTLNLNSNSFSSILISGNDIGSHLILKDNDSPITVEDNTIGKNASCVGNQNVSGSGNIIDGKAQNQCANI